ncbi:MAG: hypothetical protein AABY32_03590 [Nanoarchaeota archaeon]
MKLSAKWWLFILILIWIMGGVGIIIYYNSEINNLEIINSNTLYSPINLKNSILCKDVTSPYFSTGDEIDCNYNLETKDPDLSFFPNIKLFIDGIESNNIDIEGVNFNDYDLGNTIIVNNGNHNLKFRIYPKSAGNHRLELKSNFHKPHLIYDFKYSENLSINLNLYEEKRNLSTREWVSNYFTKNEFKFENSFNKDNVEVKLSCQDFLRTWFFNDLTSCYVDIKNNGNDELHILSKLSILKDGKDITRDDQIISLVNYFNNAAEISYSSLVGPNTNKTRLVWFVPKKSGNYTIFLQGDVIKTNLNSVAKSENNLILNFQIISREEFLQREGSKRTILITLIIALFFSTPIALKAIKELIDDNKV